MNKYGTIDDVVDIIKSNGKVLIAGNGGSASTANHFAQDLASVGIMVISLVANPATITAIANDYGYDTIFVRQLENLAESGDVLIVISASGNSPNLLRAVEYVNTFGVTVGIIGFNGGKLSKLCQLIIHTATDMGEYEEAEDKHLVVCHTITKRLRK